MANFDPNSLRQLPLFFDLTDEQLNEASRLLRPNSAAPGSALMKLDELGDEIVIIISGAVKVMVPDSDGNVTVVHIAGPGEVLGEMSVLDGEKRSATVIVLEQCGFFTITSHDFWNTLWMFAPVPFNMLRIVNRRMRMATQQLHAMRHVAPTIRVARQLASLFEEYGLADGPRLYLPFRLSVSDLASLSGVTQNDVVEFLKKARDDGQLQMDVIGRFVTREAGVLREVAG